MKRCCVVVCLCLCLLACSVPLTFTEMFGSGTDNGIAHADDCPGSYKTWPGYKPGTGGVCRTKFGIDPNLSIEDCKAGQSSITLCDDRSGGQYKTCTLSCSGSSKVKKAEAALKAALAQLATLKSGANTDLNNMKALLSEIDSLLKAITTNSNLLENSLASLNTSLATISGYLEQGKMSGQRASEILSQQLETALALREASDSGNRQTQGSTIGDPVYLASGVEELKLEDLEYRTINSLIEIERRYSSNRAGEDSPFGKGWSFNYDSRVIVGRTPLVRERAALLADYLPDAAAGDLAAKATAELGRAVAALNAAKSSSLKIQEDSVSIQNKLAQLKQERQDTLNKYEKAKNYQADAEKNAAIIGTSAARSDAARAKDYRMDIKDIAEKSELPLENTASSNSSTAQSVSQNAASRIASAQPLVSTGQAKVDEVASLAADLQQQALEAAADAAAEAADFPDNPFPADASQYFGKGFLKLVDSSGKPVLFELQADQSYKAVTDNGSYTDRIFAIPGGFQVVSKHGEIRQYRTTGKGYALLAEHIDTNGNKTVFIRSDEVLTAIIDAVGRRTELTYDDDGHITSIVDPLGRTFGYSYDNGRLVKYTDPMEHDWGYQYDDADRLVGRTDPQNNVYLYVYDMEGRVAKEIDKEGYEISYTYDPVNKLTVQTDRLGRKTRYYYNENNRLVRVYHPDMSEESFAYDGRNNIVAKKDGNGQVTTYTYNEFNDVVSITNALNEQTSITYEPRFNKIATITDPAARPARFPMTNGVICCRSGIPTALPGPSPTPPSAFRRRALTRIATSAVSSMTLSPS